MNPSMIPPVVRPYAAVRPPVSGSWPTSFGQENLHAMTRFTHPRLQGIAGYLDAVRAGLTALLDATPRAALVAGMGEGRWSGAQIVQHLGKVEGSTAKLLEGV